MSTSTATKARSTSCSTSRAARRSTSPQISVLALAEQYLSFIETVREKRIEIAADYLVMAAWLAYLKSRLMVPQAASDDEPSGEMMAALLQFRLKRLEAMRQAASRLMNRPRLGLQVYRPRHARADRRPPPPPLGSEPLRPAQGLRHQARARHPHRLHARSSAPSGRCRKRAKSSSA